MSQNVYPNIDPESVSGTQLSIYLNNFKSAFLSGLLGTTRPSEITQGGFWVDASDIANNNLSFKVFDGSNDIVIFTVNTNDDTVTFNGVSSGGGGGGSGNTTPIGIIGEIVQLPYMETPINFLLCNGDAISRTTYSDLFEKIGIEYGSGDGVTTFNLPDYRGYFLRSYSDDNTTDKDGPREVGSTQTDSFKSHSHKIASGSGGNGGYLSTGSTFGESNYQYSFSSRSSAPTSYDTSNVGNSENRPVNIAVAYYIRYEKDDVVLGSSQGEFDPDESITFTGNCVFSNASGLKIDSFLTSTDTDLIFATTGIGNIIFRANNGTTTNQVRVSNTGKVYAMSFQGDGSGLTNVVGTAYATETDRGTFRVSFADGVLNLYTQD